MLIPISQALLLDKFSKTDRAQIMAMWGIALMVGPLIGPILGGVITENFSWRWVFYQFTGRNRRNSSYFSRP